MIIKKIIINSCKEASWTGFYSLNLPSPIVFLSIIIYILYGFTMDGPYLATAVSNHHNLIVFIIKIYDILSPNHTGG